MIDLEQAEALGGARRRRDLAVARGERAVIVAPVDERVEGLAVGPDRGPAQDPVLAAVELGGLHRGLRATGRGLAPGRLDVGDGEGDVMYAVAMLADVLGDLAVRRERRGEHEADPVLDHHVAGPVADLRLEPAERHGREAPQRAVVVRCLAGVADPELDVVDAIDRQEVGGLRVRVGIDAGTRLVGGPARQGLGHERISAAGGSGPGCRASREGETTARGVGQWRHRTPRVRHWRPCRTSSIDSTALRAAYADLRPRSWHGEPWPLAKTFGTEPEAAWGPPELLAHVAEMLLFWLGELERVVEGGTDGPVPRSGAWPRTPCGSA